MKSTIPILCFLFSGLWVNAQDIYQDIARINKSYENISQLEMKSEYRWFASRTAVEPIHTANGFLQRSPNGSYHKLGPTETLINQEYAISVNHEEKIVLLQIAPEKIEPLPLEIPLDTLLGICKSYSFEEFGGKPSYLIEIKSAYADKFDKMRFVFNPRTYLIDQVILFPLEDPDAPGEFPRLEIDFFEVKTDVDFEMDLSEDRFVIQKESSWYLKPAYTDYRLLNLLVDNK